MFKIFASISGCYSMKVILMILSYLTGNMMQNKYEDEKYNIVI